MNRVQKYLRDIYYLFLNLLRTDKDFYCAYLLIISASAYLAVLLKNSGQSGEEQP